MNKCGKTDLEASNIANKQFQPYSSRSFIIKALWRTVNYGASTAEWKYMIKVQHDFTTITFQSTSEYNWNLFNAKVWIVQLQFQAHIFLCTYCFCCCCLSSLQKCTSIVAQFCKFKSVLVGQMFSKNWEFIFCCFCFCCCFRFYFCYFSIRSCANDTLQIAQK